jgi:predicted component of type VI protein secretion system
MKLSLVVLSEGKANGQRIPINLAQFVVGRDAQCHLKPASPLISKRHCAILVKDGQVYIRDFNSTNGTFVNDEQVQGQRKLEHDDELKIGPLKFRLSIEGGTPVNKPTPIPPKTSKKAASADEDVADMLLTLEDDAAAPPASDNEMAGSTVMELPAFESPPPADEAKAEKKPEPKKEEKKPSSQQSTAAAAKAILEKYTRRQR